MAHHLGNSPAPCVSAAHCRATKWRTAHASSNARILNCRLLNDLLVPQHHLAAHLKEHLGVPVRRVVVAKHAERAHDARARRRQRHQHHGLLAVRWAAWVSLAHEDGQAAARVHGAAGPPLVPVQHVLVALPARETLSLDLHFVMNRPGSIADPWRRWPNNAYACCSFCPKTTQLQAVPKSVCTAFSIHPAASNACPPPRAGSPPTS